MIKKDQSKDKPSSPTIDKALSKFNATLQTSSGDKFTGTIKFELVMRNGGIANMFLDKREIVI